MKYTKDEASYFYWHCKTAALLIEQLQERNPATWSHIRYAIRMASETAVGNAGVQYASKVAFEQKPASKRHWRGLGFIREHVVPVSVIVKRVMDAHESGVEYSWRELVHDRLTQDDLQNWNVIDSEFEHERYAPFSAVIANIVRRSAVFAWITKGENKKLGDEGLTKTMPPHHGNDDLARYRFCEIDLVPL